MHPVEATMYHSAALMWLPFGLHPAIMVASFVDLGIGAWLNHDGFLYPGAGGYFHELHHLYFDCNYGGNATPLDYYFGLYAGCKEDVKKIWGNKPSGKEGNDTYVRDDSKFDKVD